MGDLVTGNELLNRILIDLQRAGDAIGEEDEDALEAIEHTWQRARALVEAVEQITETLQVMRSALMQIEEQRDSALYEREMFKERGRILAYRELRDYLVETGGKQELITMIDELLLDTDKDGDGG